MKPRKKRKPDFRRIGPSQTYSVNELAEAVQRTPATVRRWIREGMPTLDGLKPIVIDGAQAKNWLKQQWSSRKMPTLPGEAHCFTCKKSRPFTEGTRTMKQTSAKVLTETGNCAVCGRIMNQFASAKSVSLLDTRNERKSANSAA
ncbi:MAG: hypothetical protein CMN56_11075 [Sneathiella sp.]|uniref:hypothetical protein n=1 Tax=Sneathiella sp. TaxID=1964365 RepID=UPI000C43AC1F|nr:hypothetical protein [Sneathiella sp.]MAZ03668.1 hypothetical protein [Sneathiella sp.]